MVRWMSDAQLHASVTISYQRTPAHALIDLFIAGLRILHGLSEVDSVSVNSWSIESRFHRPFGRNGG